MKVAFVLIAFNSDHVLEPCLRSVLPFGKVYAAEGPVEFWHKRGYTTSTDRTNAILEHYKVHTIHSQWSEKDQESNAALQLVPHDTDFVFCIDADEVWKEETLVEIFKTLTSDKIDRMSFKAISFFGGFDRYMTGFEHDFEVRRIMRYYPGARFATHRPPTINPPDGRGQRYMDHNATDREGWYFYHYSYVFPSQMEAKAQYYAEMGGNIPDYFDRVYLPWVTGDSMEKYRVESYFNGVHNWLPERRGECWTAPFEGEHPKEIQLAMPKLKRRLDLELGRDQEA